MCLPLCATCNHAILVTEGLCSCILERTLLAYADSRLLDVMQQMCLYLSYSLVQSVPYMDVSISGIYLINAALILTFKGQCIVIYSYNKVNKMH